MQGSHSILYLPWQNRPLCIIIVFSVSLTLLQVEGLKAGTVCLLRPPLYPWHSAQGLAQKKCSISTCETNGLRMPEMPSWIIRLRGVSLIRALGSVILKGITIWPVVNLKG